MPLFSPGYFALSHISRTVEMRDQLKRDRSVVIGFTLPRDYPATVPGRAWTWDDPSLPLGADLHCVVVIGYDDVRQAFRVQDSKGSGAFDAGGWWMGYNIVDSAIVAMACSFA